MVSSLKSHSFNAAEPIPVSYTHLDVYKRQIEEMKERFGIVNIVKEIQETDIPKLAHYEMCIRDSCTTVQLTLYPIVSINPPIPFRPICTGCFLQQGKSRLTPLI